MGVAKKLVEKRIIPNEESIVLSITGNGLKTQEAILGKVGLTQVINAKLNEFDSLVKKESLTENPKRKDSPLGY